MPSAQIRDLGASRTFYAAVLGALGRRFEVVTFPAAAPAPLAPEPPASLRGCHAEERSNCP